MTRNRHRRWPGPAAGTMSGVGTGGAVSTVNTSPGDCLEPVRELIEMARDLGALGPHGGGRFWELQVDGLTDSVALGGRQRDDG